MRFDPSQFEPLLDDARVEKVAYKVRSEFGFRRLDETEFVTFVQPARVVTQKQNGVLVQRPIEEMAVLAVVSPNPRRPGNALMTHATVSLADWLESEAVHDHYAAAPDPAHGIFRAITKVHLKQLDDLRSLLN